MPYGSPTLALAPPNEECNIIQMKMSTSMTMRAARSLDEAAPVVMPQRHLSFRRRQPPWLDPELEPELVLLPLLPLLPMLLP